MTGGSAASGVDGVDHHQTLGSAVGHAVVAVPTGDRETKVGNVCERLRRGGFDRVSKVVVLDRQRPVGLVPVEKLLAADGSLTLADVMDPDPPLVTFDTDEEVAADRMVGTPEGCLVVVGPGGGFVGLIFPDQMVPVMVTEHEEDMARIGGYLAGTRRARASSEEGIPLRLWHRLPWLIIGLVGAMVSAVIMGAFEDRLASNVLIALFVPAVVYMADAVGTQTETLLIRGLAVGVRVRDVLFREIVTGAIIGLLVGAVFTAFALAGWGDAQVAIAVGLALFASATIATGLAMVLPALFQRLGIDPAFGSGPLATVVQDLLSILTYLTVVVLVVD